MFDLVQNALLLFIKVILQNAFKQVPMYFLQPEFEMTVL